FHIGHGPVGVRFPQLDAVVVITGICAARFDQSISRRLYVSAFVDRTRAHHSLAALKAPGQPEARKRNREAWLLKARFHPALPSVDCNFDALDPAAPGPGQPCQLIESRPRQLLPPRWKRD